MVQHQFLRDVKQILKLLEVLCSCKLPKFQCNLVQDQWRLSSLSDVNNPHINTLVVKASIPIIGASSARFNFFSANS